MDNVFDEFINILKTNVDGIKSIQIGEVLGEPSRKLLPILYIINKNTIPMALETSSMARNQDVQLQLVVDYSTNAHAQNQSAKWVRLYKLIQDTNPDGSIKDKTLLQVLWKYRQIDPARNWFINPASDINIEFPSYVSPATSTRSIIYATIRFELQIS